MKDKLKKTHLQPRQGKSHNNLHCIGYLKLDEINGIFHEMILIYPLCKSEKT